MYGCIIEFLIFSSCKAVHSLVGLKKQIYILGEKQYLNKTILLLENV